ncbi:hypothetical protein D7Y21_08725 [Corallococcus sp. AB045]|nr:hypothetical protein D7Y21_08725 [Corallococcus sp. AB045]
MADTQRSVTTLEWVTDQSARAAQTLSVRSGAFILASAGLLEGATRLSARQVMDPAGKELEAKGRWTRVRPAAAGPDSQLSSDWTFSGRDDKPWTGVLTVQPVPDATGRYTAKLSITHTTSNAETAPRVAFH